MRLKGGHGYWDTTYYPIGGSFHRAPPEGKDIARITRSFPKCKGSDTAVEFADGSTGAIARENIEEQEV